MSHCRFDKPPETMKISFNGECVEACGPLLWNGDEPHDHAAQSLTINSIEIKQGRARAATNPGVQFAPAKEDWMAPDVPSDGCAKFEDGQTHAKAEVRAVLEDGQVMDEHWNETVELSH